MIFVEDDSIPFDENKQISMEPKMTREKTKMDPELKLAIQATIGFVVGFPFLHYVLRVSIGNILMLSMGGAVVVAIMYAEHELKVGRIPHHSIIYPTRS